MAISSSSRADNSQTKTFRLFLFATLVLASIGAFLSPASAQDPNSIGDLGACTLKNHIYTCDAASFQKTLTSATTVSFETHNSDGIARNTLKDLVENKLHKTVVPYGSPADLVFLLMPIDQGGQVEEMSSLRDVGTLRVYSTTPEGRAAHLLWAETYSADPTGHDLPWPIIAHGVVTKFDKRFQIK